MTAVLSGRRTLVTAGASGIGLAIANAFHEAGAQVVVCDVDEAALARVRNLRPAWGVLACDVSRREQVDALFAAVSQRYGQALDVLVNNAGIAGPTASIETLEPEEWDRTVAVNLTGVFLVTRRAVPLLKAAQGGAIINISSAAGKFGFPMRTPYSATKFGVIGMTETLAMELGPDRIRVNAILPGVVAGERQDRVLSAKALANGIDLDEQRRRAVARVSMRTMVEAEDIAQAAVFLASPAGRFVSGERLSVGGNVESLS
ncbi:MAG: 3-oxoacyl-[acyl-carrier-protein] reductase [Variovorax paradoxus]|jgi:NAD(P)-dependent dehydrogenase (short-subunit alcohol dehydrogenase family)|nr:MAG: 3-oxoacyl-[acyl-carrier-protein] reductase [Variovorax paradoxus]PZQ17576.1 MAG: 3-oxoacyl-[acyl-carrier-protein] reductase [Variovorax paradoxus]